MTTSFPLCRQHDAMQCGIACLQMICKYYGKDYSLAFLSRYCYATNEGVSLLGISDAASKLGLQTICCRIGLKKLCEFSRPCILHWKGWRRQCGVVMQDGVIFSESIARNIAVDDGEINTNRLKQAAMIANIHDYIMELPLKYNTQIGRDGVGLSQGQKQRILIARAVYKNPSYIFLDEATNALDAKNEKAIVENLNEFYKGRTVVIVAHRLSTVMNADQIIVLDNGKVVETGTHASLIERQGAYYNLVKNQLELGN